MQTSVNFSIFNTHFSADISPEMLKLGRVTNVKMLFLVLVFVFNFDYSPFISLRDIIDDTSAGCSVNTC